MDQRNTPAYSEVPCELCGTPTRATSTKRCDGCWELETRIKRNPKLAARILAAHSETALNSAAQERPLNTNGGRATGHIGQPSECLTARGEAPRVPARAECNDKKGDDVLMEIAHIVMGFENEDPATHYQMLSEIRDVIATAPQSAGVARIECSNCGAKYERYEAPCPHCSFSAVPSASGERFAQPPAMIRSALLVLLGHIEPGWDNCKWVVQEWIEGRLDENADGKLQNAADRSSAK